MPDWNHFKSSLPTGDSAQDQLLRRKYWVRFSQCQTGTISSHLCQQETVLKTNSSDGNIGSVFHNARLEPFQVIFANRRQCSRPTPPTEILGPFFTMPDWNHFKSSLPTGDSAQDQLLRR